MRRWRQAQRDLEMLGRWRNNVRQEWGVLGHPRPPDDYLDDNPDHYPPGWRLSWLIDSDDALCDLRVRLEDQARPPRWRHWRIASWLSSKLYTLGLVHGGSYTVDRYGAYVSSFGRPAAACEVR